MTNVPVAKSSVSNNANIICFTTARTCGFSLLMQAVMSSVNILKRLGPRIQLSLTPVSCFTGSVTSLQLQLTQNYTFNHSLADTCLLHFLNLQNTSVYIL